MFSLYDLFIVILLIIFVMCYDMICIDKICHILCYSVLPANFFNFICAENMFPMYLYTSVEFEANVRSRARTVSLGCLRYVVETYKHVDTLYRTDR